MPLENILSFVCKQIFQLNMDMMKDFVIIQLSDLVIYVLDETRCYMKTTNSKSLNHNRTLKTDFVVPLHQLSSFFYFSICILFFIFYVVSIVKFFLFHELTEILFCSLYWNTREVTDIPKIVREQAKVIQEVLYQRSNVP